MQRPIVLITVPHAICPPAPEYHECDYLALDAGMRLYDYLEATGAVLPIIAVPGDEDYRRVCDLNRPQCADTEYRRTLTALMDGMKDTIGVVIDMHSFPEVGGFGSADVAILDDNSYLGYGGPEPYSVRLYEDLINNTGLPISLLDGSVNDIQNEAREDFDLKAVLVEVSERMFDPSAWRDYESIISTLGDWAIGETFAQSL